MHPSPAPPRRLVATAWFPCLTALALAFASASASAKEVYEKDVAWALEERTPLGGCPHHHLCSLGGRWRQLMAEHVAMPKFDFRDLEGWDPTMGADGFDAEDDTMTAEDPPTSPR